VAADGCWPQSPATAIWAMGTEPDGGVADGPLPAGAPVLPSGLQQSPRNKPPRLVAATTLSGCAL